MLNAKWMFIIHTTTRAHALSLGNTLPNGYGVKPCLWDQATVAPIGTALRSFSKFAPHAHALIWSAVAE